MMLCSPFTNIYAQQQKSQKTKSQKGKASYYSKRSNGARTSSGIRLNNDSLVCAHRTHPFGTLLLVKNPANGKEVVVKVIDRGPHSRGRVIDISYEAARQLGILAAGVAMVDVSVYQDAQIPFRAPAYEAPEIDIDLPRKDEETIPEWQHHSAINGLTHQNNQTHQNHQTHQNSQAHQSNQTRQNVQTTKRPNDKTTKRLND